MTDERRPDDADVPDAPAGERRLDAGPRPHGLLGLLVWPLQALLLAAVNLAVALVAGLLRGLLPRLATARSRATEKARPP